MNKDIGLVWAIDEHRLPNFLTPRNCPRVTYHVGKNTSQLDIDKYFSSPTISHTIIIENKWFEKMKETTLYLYEFNTEDFILQDEIAGYYISKKTQIPVAKYEVKDLFMELFKRNVEVRMVDSLWHIADKIKTTTLHWSICRMAFAQPMEKGGKKR